MCPAISSPATQNSQWRRARGPSDALHLKMHRRNGRKWSSQQRRDDRRSKRHTNCSNCTIWAARLSSPRPVITGSNKQHHRAKLWSPQKNTTKHSRGASSRGDLFNQGNCNQGSTSRDQPTQFLAASARKEVATEGSTAIQANKQSPAARFLSTGLLLPTKFLLVPSSLSGPSCATCFSHKHAQGKCASPPLPRSFIGRG